MEAEENDNENNVNSNTVEGQSSSDDDIYPVYQIGSKSTKHNLQINETDVNIIIDSGSTVNILDESTYNQLNPKPILCSTSTKIFPYQAKSPIPLLGSIKVSAKTHNKTIEYVKFYVAKGSHGCLLSKTTAENLDLLRVGPPQQSTV